jgi:hypothetical protein
MIFTEVEVLRASKKQRRVKDAVEFRERRDIHRKGNRF